MSKYKHYTRTENLIFITPLTTSTMSYSKEENKRSLKSSLHWHNFLGHHIECKLLIVDYPTCPARFLCISFKVARGTPI